jgi:hypothetical protein
MAFWHTVYVGSQVCAKRLVGLNYLQVYTASQLEQDFKIVKIQSKKILKKCLLTKTS